MEDRDHQSTLQVKVVNLWDETSMSILYRYFYRALVVFSNQIVQSSGIAEELVQDIFLKIWKKRPSFKTTGALKAYLYNSVRNASISYLRHEKVERGRIEAIKRDFSEMQIDDSGELLLHREEVYRELLLAIDALPRRQRELFFMMVQGKTCEEIASEMGITPDSVKKQRQRGLARLRELLTPDALLLLILLISQ